MKRAIYLVGLAVAACSAHADLFSDDFEGDMSQWYSESGYITVDPFSSSNHCLAFQSLNSGGDTFSLAGFAMGSSSFYEVDFRYLGLTADSNKPTDTGGYFGLDTMGGRGGAERWELATGSDSGAQDVLIDDNTWHLYHFTFDSSVFPYSQFHIKFEDYIGSDSIAGNAMFDDVRILAVPEPATLAALGLGAAAFLLRKRTVR